MTTPNDELIADLQAESAEWTNDGNTRIPALLDRVIAALSQPAIPKTLGDTVALIVRDVCELEYPAHPDKPMLLTVSVNELSEILMDRLSQDATIQQEPDVAWCGSLEKWWAQASDDEKKRAYGESIAADHWKAKRIRDLEADLDRSQPVQQEPDSVVSRVYQLCNRYESGYGHGLKRDGLDLTKTPHADAEMGEAYQIGYDAGSIAFRGGYDAHPQPDTQPASDKAAELTDARLTGLLFTNYGYLPTDEAIPLFVRMMRTAIAADRALRADTATHDARLRDEAIEECKRFIDNGSFMHDQAPTRLFANEVIKGLDTLKTGEAK